MSPLKELLLAHLGYSAWATRRVLGACSVLTADQLDKEMGASHSNILRTLRHIHDGERVWLRRLIEVDNDRLPRGSAPEHSFESLVQYWPGLWDGYRGWVDAASDDDLTCEVSTVLPDDAVFRVPRWQIVLHAINHSTFHRGQIITMLRGFGVVPPNTDLTAYRASR
ncbi:DinB family protein [Tunturiibacter lichenicola]|uniref:DinB family protein n=1 Tax=Tunturiibacter lichenicola TaxID=2051959 RepID=UPI003D9B22E5